MLDYDDSEYLLASSTAGPVNMDCIVELPSVNVMVIAPELIPTGLRCLIGAT